jgi:hypothetical protein
MKSRLGGGREPPSVATFKVDAIIVLPVEFTQRVSHWHIGMIAPDLRKILGRKVGTHRR